MSPNPTYTIKTLIVEISNPKKGLIWTWQLTQKWWVLRNANFVGATRPSGTPTKSRRDLAWFGGNLTNYGKYLTISSRDLFTSLKQSLNNLWWYWSPMKNGGIYRVQQVSFIRFSNGKNLSLHLRLLGFDSEDPPST